MSIYEKILDNLDNYSTYSNYVATNCIFHSDNNPSLFIYEDADKPDGEGRFYCSGCGKSGSHSYLFKVLTGSNPTINASITKKEAKFLPNWEKYQDRYGSLENLVSHAHENVTRFMGYDWYFKKRKLMDLYENCLLGYIDEWAVFPLFDQQGKVIDAILRDSKGRSNYIIHPDKERESPYLYVPNWDRVMSSKVVYIVYGIVDALALELCELPVITGSTGKSLSYKRLISLNKKYAIIPDRDEDNAARKLAKDLGNFTEIKRLQFSDDTKDPDDIRMKYGIDVLRQSITGA